MPSLSRRYLDTSLLPPQAVCNIITTKIAQVQQNLLGIAATRSTCDRVYRLLVSVTVTWHSDPPPLPSLPPKTNPDYSRTPRAYPRILNSSRNHLSPPALLRITLLWPPSLNHRNCHQTLPESINASVKRHQSYHQSLRTLFGRYTIFHLSLINLSDIVWPHSFYLPFVFSLCRYPSPSGIKTRLCCNLDLSL